MKLHQTLKVCGIPECAIYIGRLAVGGVKVGGKKVWL